MPRRLAALALLLALAPVSLAQVPPEKSLATFTPGEGLGVQLFASEPMLVNPTAIDIDPFGRVWVAEAVNYRRVNFNRPILRQEGDRIVILTDVDGDGQADKSEVFYQGKELYGPLSVMVLPLPGAKAPKACRVLVAQSPDILEFTDADGDGKADGPPSKFLTGFGGFDHDHGVHGLTTGPDGKIYFTVGDQGVTGLRSKNGQGRKFVTTKTPGDCQAGTVWRCDLDGNNLELIAHNFRNNYEACVDSFGEIWLSDNDDDGNQQTRICHVMPGGNYGYWPRGAGQSHWHEEQPGIVHKTLRTGFGSPTGICFYEGSLIPGLNGQLLHCDAGPREVRAFKRVPKGAGYTLGKTLLLTSTDNWFRPSDVCVAPDGSIFVADWYDPGVGGHGMGDHTRGRIYRLAPKGRVAYKVPAVDPVNMTDPMFWSLIQSPSTSSRMWALQETQAIPRDRRWHPFGQLAERRAASPELKAMYRARAMAGLTSAAGGDSPEQARMFLVAGGLSWEAALRLNDEHGQRFIPQQLRDQLAEGITASNPADRLTPSQIRELALSLRAQPAPAAATLFYPLAKLYDGSDIFYRAALNIACGTDPARRDAILADFPAQFPEWNDKVADLVWELRPKSMLPRLGELLANPKLTAAQKARIVEILAASDDIAAGKSMLALATSAAQPGEVRAKALEQLKLFLPGKWSQLAGAPEFKSAVADLLAQADPTTGLRLVSAAKLGEFRPAVAKIAADSKLAVGIRAEAVGTFAAFPDAESVAALTPLRSDASVEPAVIQALAAQVVGRGDSAGSKQALAALVALMTDAKATPELRDAAVAALAGSRGGTGFLLSLQEKKQLPAAVVGTAGRLLRSSPFQGERNRAMILFPTTTKLDAKNLPSSNSLAQRSGSAENGKKLMAASATGELQCLKCHMVRGQGGQIGPDLSLIGKKGSKENLYDSLLYPSKAIADQYATWTAETEDGQVLTGLITGETETTVTLRDANGKDYPLPVRGTERKKSLVSLMPEGLVSTLTEAELVDLVEYLATLQSATVTPKEWKVRGPIPAEDDVAVEDGVKADVLAKAKKTTAKPDDKGYVDLAELHGDAAEKSMSVMTITLESPTEQEVSLVVGTDDACRLSVNGKVVLKHTRHLAADEQKDTVKVKLKKGANPVELLVTNGDGPHGFYFTIEGGTDVVAK